MSQECQQPQAHPARCGCEQKKPYPDRLCHTDYSAHPYRCGCLKGDAEAQRRFDEHQLSAPVPPAGSPHVFDAIRDLLESECGKQNMEFGEKITRLQAEVESLRAELAWSESDCRSLQSEMTKARAETAKAVKLVDEIHYRTLNGIGLPISVIECFLKDHQSAPAACWTPANHECPGDGVGACKKCPNAPAAKDVSDE